MALPVVDSVLDLLRVFGVTGDTVPSDDELCPAGVDSEWTATSLPVSSSALLAMSVTILAFVHVFGVCMPRFVGLLASLRPVSPGPSVTVSTRTFPSLTTYYARRGVATDSESSSVTPDDDGDSSEPLCDAEYIW